VCQTRHSSVLHHRPGRVSRGPVIVLFSLTCLLGATGLLAQSAPVVDSLTASPPSVAPGGVTTITVNAHDPDCPDTCTTGCGQYIRSDVVRWTVTDGTILSEDNGVSASPYTASAQWQAPDVEGTSTISIYLADSGGFACGGRQSITVDIDVVVTSSPNAPPVIETLTADPVLLFPGGTSNLICVATDPDEDPVSYSWEANAGTIEPGTDGTAVYTADAPGGVTVTCTAADTGGATASDSLALSVVGAMADSAITSGLTTPRRLSVDSFGNVYVVDRDGGGISVVDLFDGRFIYHIPMPGVVSVAVDWNDDLMVGDADGARLVDRSGREISTVSFAGELGDVSDVAVDAASRRYGVLHQRAGRVMLYDELGASIVTFGSTGDAPDQFRSPQGLSATPAGQWVVADTGHGLVKVFDGIGAFQTSFGGLGGGAGEFVRLDDVAVDESGVVYTSDSFQDWIQVFSLDGTFRETLGTYGTGVGQFQTAAGVATVDVYDRILGASVNSSSVQVFRTSNLPVVVPGGAIPSLAPTNLDFGEQAAGTVGLPQSVTLTNGGESPLGLQRVTVQGDFGETHDCGPMIDPGQSCNFDVTFRPGTVGPGSGLLTVDTSGEPSRVAVGLTGAAFMPAPGVRLEPASLMFGNQEMGTVSPPLPVTLTNTGDSLLEIYSVETSPHYTETDDCIGALAPAASCVIEVRFAPLTVSDQVFGLVTVSSNAGGGSSTVFLEGSSTSLLPLIAIDDRTLDEGDDGEQLDATFTVRLSEPTTETLTVDYAAVSDTAVEGDDFEPAGGTLTFEPGETDRTVTVTVLGDGILEPDEEDFFVLLTDPVNGILDDDRGIGTILDNEPCVGPGLGVNTSGEARPDGAEIPGWTQVAGTWLRRSAPPTPVDGDYYLYPSTTDYAELVQDIDVSAYAEKIDSAVQWFLFGAWARTLYEAPDDSARVVVEYRDQDNTFVLDTFDSGEFSSPGVWTLVSDARQAPIGTRWLRVYLISNYLGDAFFDAVTLQSLRAATVMVADAEEYEGDLGFVDAVFDINLACPFHEEVRLDYTTADASATEGEDYLPEVGTLAMPVGETAASLSVSIVGDEVDEGHETFGLNLTLVEPSDALVLDGEAVCRLVNDDFCPQAAEYWQAIPQLWPVDWLVIGGEEYDQPTLLDLLGYNGSDESHNLAREQIAAKLNLLTGSDPFIRPTVDAADVFLSQFPPGSRPNGKKKKDAAALAEALADYNYMTCPGGGVMP